MTLKIIYLLAFLDVFNIGVLIPLLAKHGLSLGGTHLIHGVQETVVAGLQFMAGPIVGSLSDTNGRKKMLIWSLVIQLFSCILLGFSSTLTTLFLSRIIGAMSKTIAILKALIADNIETEHQAAAYDTLGALGALGIIIGPIIGGYMYQLSKDFTKISMLLSTVSLLCIGLAAQFPKENENKSKVNKVEMGLYARFNKILREKRHIYGDIFAMKFLIELCFSQWYGTLGFVLMDTFGCNQIQFGYILGLHGILIVVASLGLKPIKQILFHQDTKATKRNVVGLGLLTTSLIGFNLTSDYFIYLFFIVPFSISRVLLSATLTEMLTKKTSDEDKGIALGAFESIMPLAGLSTPLIIGAVVKYLNLQVACSICVFTILATNSLFYYLQTQASIKSD